MMEARRGAWGLEELSDGCPTHIWQKTRLMKTNATTPPSHTNTEMEMEAGPTEAAIWQRDVTAYSQPQVTAV